MYPGSRRTAVQTRQRYQENPTDSLSLSKQAIDSPDGARNPRTRAKDVRGTIRLTAPWFSIRTDRRYSYEKIKRDEPPWPLQRMV